MNGRDDSGMVTAELAVGLPALVLVTVTAVMAVMAALAQLRGCSAAASAARLAARGAPTTQVEAVMRADAPAGATMTASDQVGQVSVAVTAPIQLPVLGAETPLRVSCTSVAPLEPGGAP